MIKDPISQTERWGFVFELIPIRYLNFENITFYTFLYIITICMKNRTI